MKAHLIAVFILLAALSGEIARAATAPALPPPPTTEQLLAYRHVQTLLDKGKGTELISNADIEGWVVTKDFLTNGKEHMNLRHWRFTHPSPSPGGVPMLEVKQFTKIKVTAKAKPEWKPPGLHLRRNFTDVLTAEDPTQATSPDKGYDDLEGALFSYTRDRKADSDSWQAEAALLLPITRTTGRGESPTQWTTKTYGVYPSLSLHRLTTEERDGATPTKEVDQFTYRVGVFGKFSSPWSPLEALTLRGWATYVTDLNQGLEIPAAQFDIEPQFFFAPRWAIGYKQTILRRNREGLTPGTEDYYDNALVAYQLRLRIHGDYGEVKDAGDIAGLARESFFRMGPVVEFKLSPFFSKRISLSASYSYLPALMGPDDHNTLFTASGEWRLVHDEENHRTISLKLTYTKGGIEVTQQKVDTVNLGLGATF